MLKVERAIGDGDDNDDSADNDNDDDDDDTVSIEEVDPNTMASAVQTNNSQNTEQAQNNNT